MIETLTGIIKEIWILLNEMSPYLIFGFVIAGVLHVLIPNEKIYKHFAKDNLSSIIKSSLFGVPLPLCSCGVIPVAAHLRKEGAGKSSTMSFLVSTPTTGVDSIMATYSLLGPLFAIIRPVSAFFGGILSGTLNNIFNKEKPGKFNQKFSCAICSIDTPHPHTFSEKISAMFLYGLVDLVKDVWKWLVIGIIAGGLISFFVPAQFIETFLGNSYIAYPVMMLIAIPMYVCATGSIPIAASLILKGMTPGAGLVFLIAGPATNTATLSFVGGKLGKKALIIYLFSIIVTALIFGFLIDGIWFSSGKDINLLGQKMKMLPEIVKISSSILLILLIINSLFKNHDDEITDSGLIYKVPDMTCEHCAQTITTALTKVKGVKEVNISIKKKNVQVIGTAKENEVKKSIQKAGYTIGK